MRCGFRPCDRDRMAEKMEGVWMGFEPLWRGLLDAQMDFADARLIVGVPNDLQMERNLTGGLSVVYQGHLASLGPFRERLTPTLKKREEGDAGGHRSAGLQNGQQGKCSDA